MQAHAMTMTQACRPSQGTHVTASPWTSQIVSHCSASPVAVYHSGDTSTLVLSDAIVEQILMPPVSFVPQREASYYSS